MKKKKEKEIARDGNEEEEAMKEGSQTKQRWRDAYIPASGFLVNQFSNLTCEKKCDAQTLKPPFSEKMGSVSVLNAGIWCFLKPQIFINR